MLFLRELVLALHCIALVHADCLISLQRDHRNILLIQNGQLHLPDDQLGNIKLKKDEIITFSCPGSQITVTKTEYVVAKCKKDDQFTIGANTFSAEKLVCSQGPQSTITRTGICLNEQYDQFKIGFDTGIGFITQSELCFNNVNKATLYEHSVVSSKIEAAQKTFMEDVNDVDVFQSAGRPDFKASPPYITSALGAKYRRAAQYATLEKTLSQPGQGLPPYMQNVPLMDVGHLGAMDDFIYAAQQKATFYFMNAAPQWNSVNTGNWNLLESNVRDLAKGSGKDYDVYTGTYGILDLEKSSSGRAKIYLDADHDLLPVPLYYWKVVIEKGGDAGIAFIGMNNVFEQQDDPCENIVKQVTWMKYGKWDNIKNGYIVACDVNKFKEIPGLKQQLPTFPTVNHVLLSY